MRPPSTTLLGAILRPVTTCRAQTRASSNGHNVTLLDKLHRKQKKAIREERALSPSLNSHTVSLNRKQVLPQSSAHDQTQPSHPNLPHLTVSTPPLLKHQTLPPNHPQHHLPSPMQSLAHDPAINYRSTTSPKGAARNISPKSARYPAT
jgi:hypothetical protein